MITADEARAKICGEEAVMEKQARTVANYLTNVVAKEAIDKMVQNRQRDIHIEYSMTEAYGKGMAKAGVGYLKPAMFGDEYDLITKRARELANNKIKKAGYEGGFYESQRGEPVYGGGDDVYYVVVLELKC